MKAEERFISSINAEDELLLINALDTPFLMKWMIVSYIQRSSDSGLECIIKNPGKMRKTEVEIEAQNPFFSLTFGNRLHRFASKDKFLKGELQKLGRLHFFENVHDKCVEMPSFRQDDYQQHINISLRRARNPEFIEKLRLNSLLRQ